MKKILSTILCGLLLCSVCGGFIGCGQKNSENVLYIEMDNAGFGVEFIDPLIDIFEAEHEGITVKKTYITKGSKTIIDKVLSGSSYLDLILVESSYGLASADRKISAGGKTYDSPFADLESIFENNIPGENIKLKDKLNPNFYDYQKTVTEEGEKHYIMPYLQAPVGFILNRDVYKTSYGKIPNTTDEMFEMFDSLPDGVTPFIDALDTSYMDDMYDVWMAQYNGSENQKKFWLGYSLYGSTAGERYVPQMFLDEGLKATLKVWDKLYDPANGYLHSLGYTVDFTSVQNLFLEGDDNILFMPCGTWLEREMSANYDPSELNIEFIKTPVVSALGTKLGISNEALSAIIDYVDGTTDTLPQFASSTGFSEEEVVKAVRDARSLVGSNHDFSGMIPAYSSKVDLAKEFLQLIASDRGIEAMLKSCGSMAPFKYDIDSSPVKSELSDFMYSANKMIENTNYCFSYHDKLFSKGNVALVNNISVRISTIFAAKSKRKDAETIYAENYNYVSEMWPTILKNAQITV